MTLRGKVWKDRDERGWAWAVIPERSELARFLWFTEEELARGLSETQGQALEDVLAVLEVAR